MFVAGGIWCLTDVSSVSPDSVCDDEGLTLETSAKHQISLMRYPSEIIIYSAVLERAPKARNRPIAR